MDIDTDYTTLQQSELIEMIKKLKEENDKLKEENYNLKKIPKHGDKKLFRDIVYHNTGFNVLKATPEQIQEAKMNAILARDYQIDTNGNVFKDKNGNPRKRLNECGNDMENVLKLSSNGILTGLGKACAYPDLLNTSCEYYL